jgi:hypothetical protein
MNFITREEYDYIQPNTDRIDIDKMNDNLAKSYLALTTIYRKMLIKYLIKKIELNKYDELIKNSGLDFVKLDDLQKDIYQKYNDESLEYVYLRNNIYISNLTDNERIEFVKLINKGGFEYNNNYERFIESTYQRVIVENTGRNEVSFVNYGPANIPFMATTNSLVIGVRWDEYNLNGKSDKEWDINHDKQIEFIDSLKNGFDRKCAKELDIPGALIKYDEYSVYMKYPAEEIKY